MARRGENIYKRRDGRYEGRYVIGRMAAGRTRFGYVYARTYAEVRRLLWEKKAKQKNKTGVRVNRQIPLSRWLRHWLENEVLGSVKPSTYQVYRRQIDGHILPALGGCGLSELTPSSSTAL